MEKQKYLDGIEKMLGTLDKSQLCYLYFFIQYYFELEVNRNGSKDE